ncbi:unnamed protein product [Calypogeia fissa]
MATDVRAVCGRSLALACRGGDRSQQCHNTDTSKKYFRRKTRETKLCCSFLSCQFHGRVSSVSAVHNLYQPGFSKGRSTSPVITMKALAEQMFTEEDLTDKGEDGVLIGTDENFLNEEEKVQYSWETEWYPLYLTDEIPREAPLALKVFDRSLVLFYDGDGNLTCLEDRCPHRLAKLSEGQIIDGAIECLYHGWQFRGDGTCSKLPQLLPGAKIPKQACARSYAIKDSQGVVWVWMAEKSTADETKLPWFKHFELENFSNISTIHEMPYDYSILLENLLDPAHIPISHDRTDPTARREEAQALEFTVTERTSRGFAGTWNSIGRPELVAELRFQAPCVISNDVLRKHPKDGVPEQISSLLLCRPAGQGKSMLIARFGLENLLKRNPQLSIFPPWLIHKTSCTVLEQDMGFLSSQNEVLCKENRPTKDLYLNMRSQDTWVLELRKWMDKVGHGMPYYWGHRTVSTSATSALEEGAPAGLVASTSASFPSQGALGSMFAREPTHRYFRHFVHCKECRKGLRFFQRGRDVTLAMAALSAGLALGVFFRSSFWRAFFVAFALLLCAASWACSRATGVLTKSYFRKHRFS